MTITMVNSLFEFLDQLLDPGGGDRIERRSRLVQQQHLRLQRDRARDAQALLLAAGEAERALARACPSLRPTARPGAAPVRRDRPCSAPRQLFVVADAVGDVVVDRHRERHRLLEHHADLAAQAVQRIAAGPGCSRRRAGPRRRRAASGRRVDAVEHAQQRRLAAAGRADDRGDLLLRDVAC